jgi:hypothetical protein
MKFAAKERGVCPTLTASMGCGGHNVPFIINCQGLRKLTEHECLGVQGCPEGFEFPNDVPRAKRYLYRSAMGSAGRWPGSWPVACAVACLGVRRHRFSVSNGCSGQWDGFNDPGIEQFAGNLLQHIGPKFRRVRSTPERGVRLGSAPH